MRVLLIHRYFWPDTSPYSSMLFTIGQKLAVNEHKVTVLSTQPSYKSTGLANRSPSFDRCSNIDIFRLDLLDESKNSRINRLLNTFLFPLRVFLFITLNRRFDAVMVSTAPPVVLGFFSALASKLVGAKLIYHCMDIHPEIGRISGEFKNPIVFKILQRLDRITCDITEQIVVLSEDMRNVLVSRGVNNQDKICVINNFSMPDHAHPGINDPKLLSSPGVFRVIFAGNIGRFQGLDVFVSAMRLLQGFSDIELVFVGEGRELENLKYLASDLGNVKFFPHQSVSIAKQLIKDSNLGVISLQEGIYKYAYPSKTMAYLREGCPVLVSVEAESELASLVDSAHVGVCVLPGDAQGISDAILSVYRGDKAFDTMRKNALKLADEMFSEPLILNKWVQLFDDIESIKCINH